MIVLNWVCVVLQIRHYYLQTIVIFCLKLAYDLIVLQLNYLLIVFYCQLLQLRLKSYPYENLSFQLVHSSLIDLDIVEW